MKQGKPLITFVMVAIAAALSVYFGFYVFDTFNDPFTTTLAYQYTVHDSVEADGLLVRQEQVLAVVDGFVRAGKRHSLTEAGYRLYAGLWVRGFWLRRPYIAIRRRLGRLRRRQQNGRKKV